MTHQFSLTHTPGARHYLFQSDRIRNSLSLWQLTESETLYDSAINVCLKSYRDTRISNKLIQLSAFNYSVRH